MADSRVMIAATGSGSGKTIITCALMRILKNIGLRVAPFKCGPDYIDPMYHRAALGMSVQALAPDGSIAAGGNLDTFFTNPETTIRLFFEGGYQDSDITVIEGVMGLYDGLGGTSVKGSSYELASVTRTPVILIINAKGMGRSILAHIKGFLDYDDRKLIRGVILNRVSSMYYGKLKTCIEDELGIDVLGYVPDDERLHIGSRHLGLMIPGVIKNNPVTDSPETSAAGIPAFLDAAASLLRESVNISAVRAIADSAERLDEPADTGLTPVLSFFEDKKIKKMAVAVDEAFSFYYRENLRVLKAGGIDLIPFSPLHDDALPDGIDAILLGGGYPEEYLEELSSNMPMKDSIKKAADAGIFIIAECGGFMYLQDIIEDKEGKAFEMTGVLPGICRWKGKLNRFGYVKLIKDSKVILGHEFHYYDSSDNGQDMKIVKAGNGREYRGMYAGDNILAGFPHLYYPSERN